MRVSAFFASPRLAVLAMSVVLALPAAPMAAAADKPAPGGYQVGDRLAPAAKGAKAQYREISWDDLIPADWQPEKLLESLDLGKLQDGDPRASEVMDKIRAEWDRAPVVERLSGQRVRIPGFVVPLEGDDKTIREFLLVPYFGACVHVPPPPANQLIHVKPDKPIPAKWNMGAVWVNGELTVERFSSDMGNAAYQLRGVSVEEYKDPLPR